MTRKAAAARTSSSEDADGRGRGADLCASGGRCYHAKPMSDDSIEELRVRIEGAAANRKAWQQTEIRRAVEETVALLDEGRLRVATPPEVEDGEWTVHAWVKQAILLYFARARSRVDDGRGPSSSTTRSRSSTTWTPRACASCHRAPRATAPSSSAGVILMPGYVNIGAWVGAGTMVDTWATVGSLRADRHATCTCRAAWASAACSSRRRRGR